MEGSFLLRQRDNSIVDAPGIQARAYGIKSRTSSLLAWVRQWRLFLTIVVTPTLLATLYYIGIAADQYVSEAHFVVKTAAQSNSAYSGGIAQMFGMGGGLNPSQSDALSVGDYLTSHDAVAALRKQVDLVGIFRRPEADWISKLWYSEPTAEDLGKYYRQQVAVSFSSETGITTMSVRAFRPADAQMLTQALLDIGEQRVNLLNQRAIDNSEKAAEQQLEQAETAVTATETGMTEFRQGERDIDPQRSSSAQIELVTGLQKQLLQAQAQFTTMKATLDPKSPQLAAQLERVKALEQQYQGQSGELAGASESKAPGLSAYEALKMRQDFAAKRYEAAATALQSAREQALKQQLYVVRLVEPNLPEKSLYPKRWLMVASVLLGTLLLYGIVTLLLAGVREHLA